jgi:hypothetical protein
MKTDQEMKKDIACKIVEFWNIVEFLSQESFPQNTKENGKKVEYVKKEQQGKLSKEEKKRKISKFTLFYNLPLEFETSEIIERDNIFYKRYPLCSSAIHLCIGKIKREILIKNLYKYLKLDDNRPEEDTNKICLIGLKVDKDGVYEENSFRISPLLWGIYKCYELDGKFDGIISSKNYYNDIKIIEEKISKIEPLKKSNIQDLYKYVLDKYIKPICGEFIEPKLEGNFIYTRYDSEKTFNREDDKAEDISELVKGFYTDDLEMVKEFLKHNDDSNMYLDIVDYILGAYCKYYDEDKMMDVGNRVDIRNSKIHIEKSLYADKAPYGKWPSKFNPALMQQIAINISISEADENRKIFSVNGPPGTGKTTLLKEIIASNIVKRAKFMCKYEKADDAFEARYFEHGNFGSKGYDQYCNKYYAFKDESLSDFSMLVASCNNAAVENITKELPDGKALISNLKPDKKDREDVAKGLLEIVNLFDTSKNINKESYKTFVKNKDGENKKIFIEKSDVYFSWLAYKLMSKSDEPETSLDINEWGLVSAPMGKSSNIGKYCYNVLNEVIDSFYWNNEIVEKRHNGYMNAKQEFSKQFSKVEGMKKELAKISRLSEYYRTRENRNEKLMQENQNELNKLQTDIQKYLKGVQSLESKKTDIIKDKLVLKNNEEKLAELFKIHEWNFQKLNNKIKGIKENIIRKEDSRKWYEILFEKWMHTERLRQIVQLREELKVTNTAAETAKNKSENSRNRHIEAARVTDKCEKQLEVISNQIKKEKESINILRKRINEENKSIENIKNSILNDRKELQDTLSEHGKDMMVINNKFWTDFDSDDEEISTSIQTANPWVTEEYNREREKLFYLALQLHKEFILSSKACRDNFKNLAMMWKYRENSNHKLCVYSQVDRNKSYRHLINTLFLLTPVMSTTFASVGRFLGNIKEQASLGLLIVDEAGQAAPHVALGALWRCKRAIVVGDPKQVEPVVTDDADAIKKAFSDKIIIPYMDKTISVQEFADRINSFGSYIKDPINMDAHPKWIGCPLIVHRRCINPMFDISNELSYGGTMKIQTSKAKEQDEVKFVKEKSCWINVSGKESGKKNHFINEQGKVALDIIISSFKKYDGLPDLYVISPFTTVINGIKDMVNQSVELKEYNDDVEKWIDNYCGTVHKFQGKEAKEVIFVLGCDEKANGAVRWVKPNIVNVAATRAKYRLYIIGDYNVWNKSNIFKITKGVVDNCKG